MKSDVFQKCELCPSRDGALKKTDTNAWAHVVCALYIPEVTFGNVSTMEPIIIRDIPRERYEKKCYICELNRMPSRAMQGACMDCNKTGCKQAFHVTCAHAAGLLCEEQSSQNVKYCGYCEEHFSKLRKNGNRTTVPALKPHSVYAAEEAASLYQQRQQSAKLGSPVSTSLNMVTQNGVTNGEERIAKPPRKRVNGFLIENNEQKRSPNHKRPKPVGSPKPRKQDSPAPQKPTSHQLVSPPITEQPAHTSPSIGSSSISSTSMVQLLEDQWEQGSQFLLVQGQHFDIASLLSSLYELQSENKILDAQLASMCSRRDHLLSVNSRLSIPLQLTTSPTRSHRLNSIYETMQASNLESPMTQLMCSRGESLCSPVTVSTSQSLLRTSADQNNRFTGLSHANIYRPTMNNMLPLVNGVVGHSSPVSSLSSPLPATSAQSQYILNSTLPENFRLSLAQPTVSPENSVAVASVLASMSHPAMMPTLYATTPR